MFGAGRRPLDGFSTLKIGLNPPRAALCERIGARTGRMFSAGLIEEVRALLGAGVPKTAKAFESIGYKQCLDFLEGRLSLAEAIDLTTIATRQYAKRQLTWFRREPGIGWIDHFGDSAPALAEARRLLADVRASVYIADPTGNRPGNV